MAYGPMSKYLTEAMGSRAVYFETKAALVAALPQITVLVTSFIGTINGSLFTGEFTLDNYRNIFAKSNTSAITNSYFFGLIAIVIVVVCGILISYLSVRKRNALTSVLDVLTMFPYIIPGSVLAGAALLLKSTKHK